MEQKILHLTLKKKWFDMILSGKKDEEYRILSPYWMNRFILFSIAEERKGENKINFENMIFDSKKYSWNEILKSYYSKLAEFDIIKFRNGYGNKVPEITIEFKGIKIGIGLYVLGAPNHPVFIISLGKILETKNIK